MHKLYTHTCMRVREKCIQSPQAIISYSAHIAHSTIYIYIYTVYTIPIYACAPTLYRILITTHDTHYTNVQLV